MPESIRRCAAFDGALASYTRRISALLGELDGVAMGYRTCCKRTGSVRSRTTGHRTNQSNARPFARTMRNSATTCGGDRRYQLRSRAASSSATVNTSSTARAAATVPAQRLDRVAPLALVAGRTRGVAGSPSSVRIAYDTFAAKALRAARLGRESRIASTPAASA
jgi:hypothetical protein